MPVEWQELTLGDIAASFDGSMVDGPFGSNLKSSEYTLTGVRLIQLQNIGDGYWKNDNAAYISQEKFATLRRHGARPGDIALAKMADPIARACIIPTLEQQYLVVADCIKLTVNQNQFEPSFIVRAINFHKFRTQAEQAGIGTTRQRVNLSQVRRLSISMPSLHEQRRIAKVLDTLDRTIEGTQRVIGKLQATRQGLLHDLLTRGLDERGQLRDPERNPEQFKETELGRVPLEWTVAPLGELTRIRRGASPRPIDDAKWFADFGPGWVRIVDVTRSNGTLNKTEQYLSAAGAARSVHVYPGEVIMSIAATVGEPALVGIHACIHDGFVVFDRHEATFQAPYLVVLLKSIQAHLRSQGQTGTQANLNTSIVGSTVVAAPDLAEQQRILDGVRGLDKRIAAEKSRLAKLQALKRGLMDDLLTGRVRVPMSAAEVKDSDVGHPVRPAAQIAVPENLPVIPTMAALAPQPAMYRAAAGADTQAMTDWTRQLVEAVQGQQVSTYTPDALDAVLPELMRLTADRQGLLKVPEVMAKAGIRFMLLPHPSQSKANGAAFYLDEPGRTQPVVGLSLRYPYLDVFWFNLLHELAHIRLGHEPVPEESLEEYDITSPNEVAANRWAQDLLIPPAEWQAFFAQHPASDPQLFHLARQIGRHVSIVAGRYGHETKNWKRVNPPKLRPTVTTELMTLSRMLTGEP